MNGMNGMNGMGKVLSPGMPQGMPLGMTPGMPQAMPGMNQAIPPAMQQGMQQGMPPGVPPQQMPPQRSDVNARNEEEFNKESESINSFLNTILEVQLPISDKVINNICAQAGFSTSDPRLARLLSFVSEYLTILALTECRKVTQKRTDLQLTDVKKVLETMNINVHRPEYIVNPIDSEATGIDENQLFDLSSTIEDTQMFD